MLPTPPPALHAAPAMPITDGIRRAAWIVPRTKTSVAVLGDDQPLSAPTRLTAPPGCGLDAMSTAALGWWCGSPLLQDPITGTTTVPPVTADLERRDDESWEISGLGTAAIDLHVTGEHVDYTLRRRLADGEDLGAAEPTDPHRVASLDDPSGTVALCAPLQVSSTTIRSSGERFRDPTAYRPPWLLTVHGGELQLRHCGSSRVQVLQHHADEDDVVLARHWVAWLHGRDAPRRPLLVKRLTDGRTWRYPARSTGPRGGGSQYLVHTARRLWIGASAHARVLEVG